MKSCSSEPCQMANDCAEREAESTYSFISPLCQAFGPINISFCAAGIFPNYDGSKISGMWFWKIAYSVCVICLLVITTARWIFSAAYEHQITFGVDLFLKILLVNWGLESTAHYIGCAVTFACSSRLMEFFKEWKKLRTPNSLELSGIYKKCWFYVAVAFGFTVFDASLFLYCHIWSPRAATFISPVPPSTPYAHVVIILTIIAGAYMTFAWIVPSLLMHLIGKSLTLEFISNCEDLTDLEKCDPITFANTIKCVRIRHQKISKLVCSADRIFSMHIAFTFMGTIVAVCFMLYNLIWDPNPDFMHIVMGISWVVAVLGKTTLDCVTGATLNNAVCCLPIC